MKTAKAEPARTPEPLTKPIGLGDTLFFYDPQRLQPHRPRVAIVNDINGDGTYSVTVLNNTHDCIGRMMHPTTFEHQVTLVEPQPKVGYQFGVPRGLSHLPIPIASPTEVPVPAKAEPEKVEA